MKAETRVCTNPNNISSEHILQSWKNGIRLVRPGKNEPSSSNNLSVTSALKNDFNIYFMDLESQLKAINSQTIINCGFNSEKDAIGRTARDVAKNKSAENLIQNDRNVIRSNKPVISDDLYEGLNAACNFSALSMKFPWYGDNSQIIGVFGCSIVLGKNSLASALAQISEFGLLNLNNHEASFSKVETDYLRFYMDKKSVKKVELTPRETEVLDLLIQGKNTKEMAAQLYLSKRTVEHHIENIKDKMGVSSRYELIIKAINYFK